MIGGLGIKKLKDAIHLNRLECNKLGKDILAEGYVYRHNTNYRQDKRA